MGLVLRIYPHPRFQEEEGCEYTGIICQVKK
jgi:hypothetical protein